MRTCAFALLMAVLLGAACVLRPYDPTGKGCDVAHPCPGGLACIAGACAPCAGAVDCGGGLVCTAGVCGACSAEKACPSGESCSLAGVCEPQCGATLQALVDQAPAGAVVLVPGCIYREHVTLSRPVTLAGRPGAEVRGSEVWTRWTASNGLYVGDPAPTFASHGACAQGETRCQWPEQVFLDGAPLKQVAGTPASGEFSLGVGRAITLRDDPRSRVVEVTTRRRWVTTASDGVTLRGLSFRHAASDLEGALSNDGHSDWTLEQSTLRDSHGPLVTAQRGGEVEIRGNTFERAGQVAIRGYSISTLTVAQNEISSANTEGFDPESVAGGVSLRAVSDSSVRENGISKSAARGIALEDCVRVVISGNRIHHNAWSGIFFGNSQAGTVTSNVVFESGWGSDSVWGWGAGLLVWASSDVDVGSNLVAWTPDGITTISQGQSNPAWLVKNVRVHDNLVFGTDDPSETTLWKLSLGWLEDWSGPMFVQSSGNTGTNNRFWSDTPENTNLWRFSWNSNTNGFFRITDFAQTPGGSGSSYLTNAEKAAVLGDAGVPPTPEAH